MIALQKLYVMILTYFFKGKQFEILVFWKQANIKPYICILAPRTCGIFTVSCFSWSKRCPSCQSECLQEISLDWKLSTQSILALLGLLDPSATFDMIDWYTVEAPGNNTETTLVWMRYYITDRKQLVKVDLSKSTNINLICEVPQGSILRPLLFVLYTKDITTASNIMDCLTTVMLTTCSCTKTLAKEFGSACPSGWWFGNPINRWYMEPWSIFDSHLD